MNTIKKIGLATSLLCASSFANAAVYELGDMASYNPLKNYSDYNDDGFDFRSFENIDHEYIFYNDSDDYAFLEVKTFINTSISTRIPVSGKFSDTFTFSLSKESELTTGAATRPGVIDFSLMQIGDFVATLNTVDTIIDEFGNNYDSYNDYYDYYDYYDYLRDYYFNSNDDFFNNDDYGYYDYVHDIYQRTGSWPELTLDEYLVEQQPFTTVTFFPSTSLESITLSAGTYSLIVEGEAYTPSTYSIYIHSITHVSTTLITSVPEPSSIALMLGGLGLVGFMAARRKKALT